MNFFFIRFQVKIVVFFSRQIRCAENRYRKIRWFQNTSKFKFAKRVFSAGEPTRTRLGQLPSNAIIANDIATIALQIKRECHGGRWFSRHRSTQSGDRGGSFYTEFIIVPFSRYYCVRPHRNNE